MIALVLASPLAAQSYDWPGFLRELQSKETAVKEMAQKRLFEQVLPELSQREPDRLEPELSGLLRAAEQDESLRLEASAVLYALQTGRPDSSVAFRAIIPSVLAQLGDMNVRVRRNAAFIILNLKPDIPEMAIQPFIDILEDGDPETVRAAILGLGTLCKNPIAAKAYINLMNSRESKQRMLTAIEAVGSTKCMDNEVLLQLRKALEDNDREIVLAGIRSVGWFGPAGQIFKRDLDRLALTNKDQEIAKAASSVSEHLP
jgi:hypothetical protein